MMLKQIIRALFLPSLRRKKDAAPLTEDQYRAISIGAVLNSQGSYYINALETGGDKSIEDNKLQNWWDIYDAQSARETIDFLKKSGHRIYYPHAVKTLNTVDANEWQQKTNEAGFEDPDTALYYLYNLTNSISSLKEDGVIKKSEDLQVDITAWDLGRLSCLARTFYTLNYISEAETWDVLMYSLKECQKVYKNWDEFAKGYIIGRAMWSGNNDIFSTVENLLKNKKSPWKEVSLK